MGLNVFYNTLSQTWKTHLPWRERQSHSASGCQAGLLWGGGRGFRRRQRAETEGGACQWWARRGCCCSMLHSLVRWTALRWTSKSTTHNQRVPVNSCFITRPKSSGTPWHFLTSNKPIRIFFDSRGMKMFEKAVMKGCNISVFNSNPYIVAYHWKGVLTRKIMEFRKDEWNIPAQIGSVSWLLVLTLTDHHFEHNCSCTHK